MHFIDVFCIFLSVVCCSALKSEIITYEKAQLWKAHMRHAEDVAYIQKLIDSQGFVSTSIFAVDCTYPYYKQAQLSYLMALDVSRCIIPCHLTSRQADFIVLPEKITKNMQRLKNQMINFTVLMKNIQRSVETQMDPGNNFWNENTLRQGHRLDFTSYAPLDIIEEYYNFLADEYPSLCKVQVIGRTSEGLNIQMINVTNGDPRNKVIVIIGGLHGREWASITSTLHVLNKIVTEFDYLPTHMKTINWLIIPLVNPDGYKFTRTSNRFWRKNRHHFNNKCTGVDLNRNFGMHWTMTNLTKNNKCKDEYAGPHPTSELETKAVQALIMNLTEKPSALLDIHTYGGHILYPWSGKKEKTKDFHLHKLTASGMVEAISSDCGVTYTHGATFRTIYPASGSLLDWGYSQGITHSYVIETSDKENYGFLLPGFKIVEVGEEVYSAIDFLAKSIVPPDVLRNHRRSWF